MQKGLMLSGLFLIMLITNSANAAMYGGVSFPGGAASFADEVVGYNPGPNVDSFIVDGQTINPMLPDYSLGTPDTWEEDPDTGLFLPTNPGGGLVSLGDGGELILKFTDNALTTSSDDSDDLWIFEVGWDEPTNVSISTAGIAWIDVGVAGGAASGIDIDAYIGSGVELGGIYSYVRMVDVLEDYVTPNPVAGADIDAVGAISTVPIPGAVWLFASGLIGLVGIRRRLNK